MIEARIVKVIMVGCLAVFALLVTFDNVIDYDTNYTFVRHVLTMDTTFPGNALLYRRITSAAMWQAGYALIIAGEGLTGAVLTAAAVVLGRRLRSGAAAFNRAKRSCISAPGSVSWCGSSASWSSAANGFRCGNRRCGMAKRRRFAFT